MSEEPKNPYTDMTTDVLNKHLEQLKSVIAEKKIDVSQYFGTPISDEDKKKLEEHKALSDQVNKYVEAANSATLSATEIKLSQQNLDRLVNDIKNIDPDVPLDGVIGSKFNNLEKIDILTGVQGIVKHYDEQIDTLKKEIATDTTSVKQTFGAPEEKGTAADIIKSLAKTEEVK